jgi:transcriptional regulator with XRE-family HTH domain
MEEGMHKQRFGRDLEVHRLIPKCDYDSKWGVCVTLCDVCHLAIHGNGSWGWITRDDPHDDEQLASWIGRSTRQDQNEESDWRRRQVWGSFLVELRKAAKLKPHTLAISADISTKRLSDLECGRSEPFLSEAHRLAKALGIALKDLIYEEEPGDSWIEPANERSDARALAFRAREAREGEVLAPGAALIFEIVRKSDEMREAARGVLPLPKRLRS